MMPGMPPFTWLALPGRARPDAPRPQHPEPSPGSPPEPPPGSPQPLSTGTGPASGKPRRTTAPWRRPARPRPAPDGGTADPDGTARRRAHRGLVAVCVAFGALSLLLVGPRLPLGWDELVYASRYAEFAPTTPFSAPRTRGVPVLLAPVAWFSGSVVLLRCWLTLLAAAALYLAYRPWLRAASRPGTAAWAAAGYGSIWFALFYAGAAMPNHYVATGCTAAVGCWLRLVRGPERRTARRLGLATAAALAVATLMRPNDTVWPALVLVGAALCARSRPTGARLRAGAAVAAGVAAGAVPWVVEAWVRFGGVGARLRAAGEVQGGMRPVFSLPEHLAALDGPLLCRPCTASGLDGAVVWWLLLASLVLLGVRAAHRAGRRAAAVVPVAAGLAVAAPYLFLVDYAAPRFLLPTYALLAPVAVEGARTLLTPREGRHPAVTARVTVAARVLACLLAATHLGVQLHQVTVHRGIQSGARGDWRLVERALRAHGVTPPCALAGNRTLIPVAHTAGCRALGPARAPDTGEGPPDTGQGPPVRPSALVLRNRPLPDWAARRGWRIHPVPGTYASGWRIAVPPDTARPGPQRR